MKIVLSNKTFELKKTAKPDDVFTICIDVIKENPSEDPIKLLKEMRSQYTTNAVPMYINLRLALDNLCVTQKELAEVLALTPQDVNRRLSGITRWKPLEKRVIVQFLTEHGITYTEEQLFSQSRG